MQLKLEGLFEDAANLFGDRFNLWFLEKSLQASGENFETIHTDLNGSPRFVQDPDVRFVYMGSMPEHVQEMAVKRLMPYKEAIRQRIEEGVVFLVTGNAGELFLDAINDQESGYHLDCLGLFRGHAERKMLKRYSSMFLGTLEEEGQEPLQVVASKNQFAFWYDTDPSLCFLKVEKGTGNCPGAKGDGIHYRNFMAANLQGPLLIENPLLLKRVMSKIGVKTPVIAYEEDAMGAYRTRLQGRTSPQGSRAYT